MNKKNIKIRIEKLKKEIAHHRYLYHVKDKQEISDAALDSLKHELVQLEAKYPDFITPDSPTQRVGGRPLSHFEKVIHSAPMLSLEDAFSEAQMRAWEERIKKVYKAGKFTYFVELKIDGFAISLRYVHGVLDIAATRGDGAVGENVTANIKTIEAIPLSLIDTHLSCVSKNKIKDSIEVRGEVFMTKKVFKQINTKRKKKGASEYANPRNTAAGSIRQLNPHVAASRKLEFIAYAISTDINQNSHAQEHKIAHVLGFHTDTFAKECMDLDEVFVVYREIEKKRESLAYQIDGIVVSVNDNKTFSCLGVAGKAPRGAIAFKFPAEEATTVVLDIIVQVGRTGVLTPVAHLKSVSIGGTLVSHASLHNLDEIIRLGVKKGDTVIVKRAGDVIPKVVRVLTKLRTGKEKKFSMPRHCPVCGKDTLRVKGEVAYKCINRDCPAKNKEALAHFTSRKAFNIVGLGEKILSKLSDIGLLSDTADIFLLEKGDIAPLDGFGDKSADNLIIAITKSRQVSLSRFLYALGILHVGEETARDLASYLCKDADITKPYDLWITMQNQNIDKLVTISDIGDRVAESVINYFHHIYTKKLLQKFTDAGIIITHQKRNISNVFALKSFVFTGELQHMSRESAQDKVREYGGSATNAVSSKTTYVVAGKNPGSKYTKAKKLGVKILSEKEFLKLIHHKS